MTDMPEKNKSPNNLAKKSTSSRIGPLVNDQMTEEAYMAVITRELAEIKAEKALLKNKSDEPR